MQTTPQTASSDTGKDLFQYDQAIVKQINRIEDVTTKFAIRNYVTSGAVLAAFFATKIPLWVAFLVVLVLNVNFVWAIAANNWRFKILLAIHEATRNAWFKSETRNALFEKIEPDLKSCPFPAVGVRLCFKWISSTQRLLRTCFLQLRHVCCFIWNDVESLFDEGR